MRRAGPSARAAVTRTTTPARAHDLGSVHDLGQTGRGRDIVLASRPRLEELVSQHPFWCRDLAEVRSRKSLVVT